MIGGVIVLAVVIIAIFANFFSPYDPNAMDTLSLRAPLSSEHPMGTDEFGRDYMARVFFGARISMEVGLISVSIAMVFGILIGAIAGFYEGWIDNILMRIMDAILSFPSCPSLQLEVGHSGLKNSSLLQ